MRQDLVEVGAEPLEFVGAYNLRHSHMEVADAMRSALGVSNGWAEAMPTWTDALRFLRDRLDTVGVLMTFNGIVGNNTSRKLDRDRVSRFCPSR